MTQKEASPDQRPPGPRDRDELVVVGRIARPHGLKGEVRVFPAVGCEQLYPQITRFYVESAGGLLELVPHRLRPANRYIILGFEGYQDRGQAERLRDRTLWASPADLPELEPGDVYQFTQLGALIYDEDGRELGKVEEILESAAHPIFRVVGPEGEFLFPAAEPFLISHHLREGVPVIVIHLPPGLIESQTTRSPENP